jgi:hypothetical protein
MLLVFAMLCLGAIAQVPVYDPGPGVNGIDPWPTEANAQANSAVASANNVIGLNSNLLTLYQGRWNDWAYQVRAGSITPENPPQPPPAWVAFKSADGYTYIKVGTVPICALPPTPPGPPPITVPVQGTIQVGNKIASDPAGVWFTVGYGDTLPPGQSTPPGTKSADGVAGTFRKFGSPFGGWYEKIQ